MTQRSTEFDIVVCGATGFTGKLVAEYLSNSKEAFKFAIAGRNQAKLDAIGLDVETILYDAMSFEQTDALAQRTKVVLTLTGPYMIYGEPLIKACAAHGTHYVDLTGEPHWHLKMLEMYAELAASTGAIIVPASGFDSIPGDITTFLAAQTLREAGAAPGSISTVRAGYLANGGVSGGTVGSMLSSFTHATPELLKAASAPWALSPVSGVAPPPRFSTFNDPISKKRGGFFVMAPSNEAIVRRSAGLLEQAGSAQRYGPKFDYVEFTITKSALSAKLLSGISAVAGFLLKSFSFVRTLISKYGPQSGDGPKELDKGMFFQTTTSAVASKPDGSRLAAKVVMIGDGDPGYRCTSIMIAEAALLLATTERAELPELAQKGGMLTPATALGQLFVERLKATGRFTFSAEIVE